MILKRLERWSTWAYNGGVREQIYPRHMGWIGDARMTLSTDGEARLSFTAPITIRDYAGITTSSVFRAVMTDGSWSEWLVLDIDDTSSAPGSAQIICGGFLSALKKAGRISQTDGDGVTAYQFEAPGLTATQHLSTHIVATAVAAGLTCVAVGTVQPTGHFDVSYDAYAPLDGLKALAEVTASEYRARRDDAAQVYRLELITQIGVTDAGDPPGRLLLETGTDIVLMEDGTSAVLDEAEATANTDQRGDLRVRRNATIRRYRSRLSQITRVIPLGAERGTMGPALWEISAKATNVLTLADPDGGAGPVGEVDQFVGYRLRTVAGADVAITACDPDTHEITVADGSGFTVGDHVGFRLPSGAQLTFLPSPLYEGISGILTDTIDRGDIPRIANLLRNAAMRAWSGPATVPPDTWAAVGTPTLDRITTAGYTNHGGWSCRVQTNADGEGLASPLEPISPTALAPYFAGFAAVRVASGRARIEVVFTDGVTDWTFPDGAPTKQVIEVRDALDFWGAQGFDAYARGATHARVRVVQDGAGTADFYVDSAQLTHTATQQDFVEGSGPRRLHQAGNIARAVRGPVPVRYEVDLVDLYAIDGTRYPYDQLQLGSYHRVRDPRLGIVDGVRLLAIDRNLYDAGDVRVTLSSRPEDLVRAQLAMARLGGSAETVTSASPRPGAGRFVSDAVASGTTALTSATGAFSAEDEGRTLWLFNGLAGGGILKTTVVAVVDASEVTLAAPAGVTATGLTAILGSAEEVLTLAGGVGGSRAGGALFDEAGNLTDQVKDAQGRDVDRFFAKPLNSDPDDFDSISDGTVYQKDLVQVILSVVATATDDTEVTFQATASDPIGGAAPTIGVTPSGGVTDNGGGSYTIARPAAGDGTAYYAFAATKTGRRAAVVVVAVPEIGSTGASLDVKAVTDGSDTTITYTSDVTVELSIDGAAYSTAPASPIVVARPAAGSAPLTYAFRAAAAGGQVVTNTITVPPLDADTVTPDLAVLPGTQTATTQPFTVGASNPSGGAAPTLTVLLKGCTGSGSVTGAIAADSETTISSGEVITVTRPAFNSAPASATFKASLSGGGSEVIQRTILNQDKTSFGPSLDVKAVNSSTQTTITYTSDGTVELAIDGGSYAAPSASPIVVTRPAAGSVPKSYAFRCTKDGQVVTNTVEVPAIDADTVSPDLAVVQSSVSATTVAFVVTATNPKSGGPAPSISVLLTGTTGAASTSGSIANGTPKAVNSGETITINRQAFANNPVMAAFSASISGGGTEQILRTILNQDRTQFGPNLQVTTTPGPSSFSIAYTVRSGSTLTYSTDGGSYVSLGSSPLVITRDGDDQTISIKAVFNGEEQITVVVVPALSGGTVPPSIPAFYASQYNISTNQIELVFTVANAPGGYTLDVQWSRAEGGDGGNSGSITGISTTSPYQFDTDTHDPNAELVSKGGSAIAVNYRFTLIMKNGSTVVATATSSITVWSDPIIP